MAGLKSHPDRIAGHNVLAVLGHGAKSAIYAVQHPRTGQVYALKHVRREVASDYKFIEQALSEYRIASKLDHPALRKIYRLKRKFRLLSVGEVLTPELTELHQRSRDKKGV